MGELIQFRPRPRKDNFDPWSVENLMFWHDFQLRLAASALGFDDTAPSEYCAPTDDSA